MSELVKGQVSSLARSGFGEEKPFQGNVFAARGTRSSAVLLIYYFASCGPTQGDEVRETMMRSGPVWRACVPRVCEKTCAHDARGKIWGPEDGHHDGGGEHKVSGSAS